MTSRERAKLVLNHQEAGRPLRDFGGTVVSSMTVSAHEKLKKFLGIEYAEKDPIVDYMMGVVTPCEEIQELFDTDFRRIAPNLAPPKVIDGIWTDAWGIKRKKAEPHDYYDVVDNPLKNAAIDDLFTYPWPDVDDPAIYEGLEERVSNLYENSSHCIIADLAAPGLFGSGTRMRGYEQFLIDMMTDEEFASAFLGKLVQLTYTNYLDKVGKYIQVVCFNDDFGMQDRMFMSPETFRKILKPHLKEFFSHIKNLTDAKLFLHSCGSVYPIIEDLIEIGVDILNPIQPQAKDMDLIKLKREFGERLVLWGGIDEQGYLMNGTAADVRENVRCITEVMSKGGGYVLAPSHNIQDDIPCENIIAMYKYA